MSQLHGDEGGKKDDFSSPNPYKNKKIYKKLNLTFTQEDLIKILDDPKVQKELVEFERSFVTPYEVQPPSRGYKGSEKKRSN